MSSFEDYVLVLGLATAFGGGLYFGAPTEIIAGSIFLVFIIYFLVKGSGNNNPDPLNLGNNGPSFNSTTNPGNGGGGGNGGGNSETNL